MFFFHGWTKPLPLIFQDFPWKIPVDSSIHLQAEQEEAKTREDTKIKALEGELVRVPGWSWDMADLGHWPAEDAPF